MRHSLGGVVCAAAMVAVFASWAGAGEKQSRVLQVSGTGFLYLYGNEIRSPWELSVVGTRVCVNGLALPAPVITKEDAFLRRVSLLADSLIVARTPAEQASRLIRRYCAASGFRAEVTAREETVAVRNPDWSQRQLSVHVLDVKLPHKPPRKFFIERPVMNDVPEQGPDELVKILESTAEVLEKGNGVFISGLGFSTIVPRSKVGEVRRQILTLRAGGHVDSAIWKSLPRRDWDQVVAPAKLERVGNHDRS